jgi:hypothetical protein
MAIEVYVRKLYNTFAPDSQADEDAMEALKPGGVYKAVFTQPRNYKYHQKFFVLLDVAYEAWEAPELEHKGVQVAKNRERFRKDIIIQCGFYDLSVGIDGRVRCDAKSISFAGMDQDEFEILYSTAIDVILGKVLKDYTRDDLDEQVNRVLRFA